MNLKTKMPLGLKILIALISAFIVTNNFMFGPGNILSWDVFGYYLYLPFTFIYNDLGLENESTIQGIIEKYESTGSFYQASKRPNGIHVMKYTMGMAFFYAPFFFIGHLIALVSDYPVDGFSAPYKYSIFVGGIIYSIVGIWVLAKVLLRFFNPKIAAITLLIIVFGTNYVVQNTMYGANAMSHNYLFTTYALILWLTIRWHETYRLKHAIWLAVVCGISILSRPTEIVCLFIPLLWNLQLPISIKERVAYFRPYKRQIKIFTAILITIGLFQIVYWLIFSGKLINTNYGGNAGEGLDFLNPHTVDFLFSFRKGWLLYTPIMTFAIIGFYFVYKYNRTIFYALFVYFILNLYLVSSWTCWWYAQSFSARPMIPSYPIMAIAMGYFLTWLSNVRILKWIVLLLIIGFIGLNLFQSKQLHFGVISGDRMTKAYYFKVFGKMYVSDEDKKLLLIERSFYTPETDFNESEYNVKLLDKLDFEYSEIKDSTFAYSGNYSYKMDSVNFYTTNITAKYNELTKKDHAFLKITAFVYPTHSLADNPFALVAQFEYKRRGYGHLNLTSDKMELKLNEWNKVTLIYLTPEVRNKKDLLKVYFTHYGKYPVYIDDLQVEVFDRK